MLDALTPLDPDDFDLDALDAALADRPSRTDAPPVGDAAPPPPPSPRTRARAGTQKTPRRKGEPLDPERIAAAKIGLPYFSKMQWVQVGMALFVPMLAAGPVGRGDELPRGDAA